MGGTVSIKGEKIDLKLIYLWLCAISICLIFLTFVLGKKSLLWEVLTGAVLFPVYGLLALEFVLCWGFGFGYF